MLNNVQVRFNSNQKIYPQYWSNKEHSAIWLKLNVAKPLLPDLKVSKQPTKAEIEGINGALNQIRSKVKSIENKFIVPLQENQYFEPSLISVSYPQQFHITKRY